NRVCRRRRSPPGAANGPADCGLTVSRRDGKGVFMNNRLLLFRPRRVPGIPFLAAAFLTLSLLAAQAHARLERSSPADKAALDRAPDKIELWFNELLDEGFNPIEVFPAAELKEKKHTNFAVNKPAVDANDHTRLSVALKPLPPGDYVVEWRVLSRDGH